MGEQVHADKVMGSTSALGSSAQRRPPNLPRLQVKHAPPKSGMLQHGVGSAAFSRSFSAPCPHQPVTLRNQAEAIGKSRSADLGALGCSRFKMQASKPSRMSGRVQMSCYQPPVPDMDRALQLMRKMKLNEAQMAAACSPPEAPLMIRAGDASTGV